ncbi:MAG: acetyl-CoA carboxylase carboxyltransferase subunit [Acidimicrobiia bacterium]|nr:acetyl-CoA carboxylase carboxyltransferase subunit [Acidimicrobiia bacterium]
MGGDERLARQREGDRLDARARIEALLDPTSFQEIGAHVGGIGRGMTPIAPADGLVAGHGLIGGRPVLVGSEDFTVMGGSIGFGTRAKRLRLAELAARERVPLIMLLEGAGERAQNAYERAPHAPTDLQALVRLSGVVPTVAVVMGPSAGHSALTAALMDFTIIVEGAALFAAGPPLVAAATGEEVTKEDLGGAGVHSTRSGVAHNVAADDRSALDLVRCYLSFLPSNAWMTTPAAPPVDTARVEELLDAIPADPRRPYDAHRVLELIADPGSVLVVQPGFGRSIITAFARLGGEAVAVVANNPAVEAGAIDTDAADKAAHFLDVSGAFHLPVVFLADNPGVLVGSVAEHSGILRHSARMYAAQARLAGPKFHVTVRKAYGFGSALMAMNPFDGQTTTLAFPGARLGAMPAESGAESAAIEADVQAIMEQAELGGAYSSADHLSYDDVIDPRDLRAALGAAMRLTVPRRGVAPGPVAHTGIHP